MIRRVLVAVAALVMISCDKDPFEHDARTPRWGLRVQTNGHDPDLSRIDAKYEDVAHCLGLDPAAYTTRFLVVRVVAPAGSRIRCGDLSPAGECAGLADLASRWVKTPEDLPALAHELAHVMGQEPEHGEITEVCGDDIDRLHR